MEEGGSITDFANHQICRCDDHTFISGGFWKLTEFYVITFAATELEENL